MFCMADFKCMYFKSARLNLHEIIPKIHANMEPERGQSGNEELGMMGDLGFDVVAARARETVPEAGAVPED